MTLPVSPLALLFALIPIALLFAMPYWRFSVPKPFALGPVVTFAVAVALLAAATVVAASYAFGALQALHEPLVIFGIPVFAYIATLAIVGAKRKITTRSFAIGGLVGVVPLCLLGFYTMLVVACSFGDCL